MAESMTSLWIATIGSSLICYLLKFLGYSLPKSTLNNPKLQRINELIPIVLLSALVANQTLTQSGKLTVDHRIAGVLVAAVALKMRAPFPIMMLAAAIASASIYNLS